MRIRMRRPVPQITLLVLTLMLFACSPENYPTPRELWETSAHADAEAAAFTNWDDRDPAEIPQACAKCHSTHGYRDYLGDDGSQPVIIDQPAAVGTTIECEACHNETAEIKTAALMPSEKMIEGLGQESNCMECHQGRTSGVQVQNVIDGMDLDTVVEEVVFINIHNQAPAPTQYGTIAMGGYEYAGKDYAERYEHKAEFDTCIECHDAHTLSIRVESCSACHGGVSTAADLRNIRTTGTDYDLDGDLNEGIAYEIDSLLGLLLRSMNLYTLGIEGLDQLQYESQSPYFLDQDGEQYRTWTPRLLRAAFNYHYVAKETGGYAHHSRYHLQLLYDSLEDLGTDTRVLTRPDS